MSMRGNTKLTRGLLALAALFSVALIAWLFLPPCVGAFVSVTHLDYFKDLNDPRTLVDSSDDIFFGEVIEKLGQTSSHGWVETQYSVQVLEVFKGSLSGEVTVNLHGGYDRWTRTIHTVNGAPDMPELGNTYLFATRFNSAENWHTFPPGYGDIQIRDTAHAAHLRRTFTEAAGNQTVSTP